MDGVSLKPTFTAHSPPVSSWFCWLALNLALAFSTAAGNPRPTAIGPSGGGRISSAGERMGVVLKYELGDWFLCKSQATICGGAKDLLEGLMTELNSK